MLCFIEVFIVVGEAISHALSILVTWTQMNLLTTGVISLNLLSLILLRMTSRRQDDRMMVCHYNRSSSSVGPYCELLRDPDQTVYQDETVSSANTSYQFADDDKCYVQKLRYYIFVCLALFVFRDFSCVHVFKKSIRCIFVGLNIKSMTYEQWSLLVTALQLIFTTSTVCMVEIYGRRKLLLISSLGMLLAATGLEQFIFNIEAFTSKETRHVYIMAVLLIYIIFFAQGLSSTPWAMTFKIIHQNVRSFTLGFIISAHFLFLMIVEFSYINEEHIYSEHSTAAYWLIIIYLLQTIFVYTFVMDTKS
ncbi:uncharacterized protein LOC114121104 [Aphis gossypii]|uniref:uncharacterized protein LOC114121104 n=1 Tax=Aphis gossypii TaxID=80765 RepID=UPI0021592764|nr:uncharacterized protein LOC114121104 [Aphis gossypii]